MTGWRSAVGYLYLLVTAIGWAGAWLTARLAAHDLDPLTVTWGRFIIAAAVLLPFWLALERGRLRALTAADGWTLFAMSLTGIVGYTILFMIGVAYAPATDGAVIAPGLAGVFTLLLGSIAFSERPPGRAIAGAVFAAVGSLLVGWSAVSASSTEPGRLFGDAVYAVSAVVWAVYTVLGRRLAGRVPAISGVLIASVIGVVLMTPVVLWREGLPNPLEWTAAARLNVIYLGSAATALAFVTYYLTVKILGIPRAAPALGLVPFFAVLGAHFLLDEPLTLLHVLGGAFVIAGILLPARRPTPAGR